MFGGLSYERISDAGLSVSFGGEHAELLEADNVILCAGQIPNRTLYTEIQQSGFDNLHLIGGADEAAELDAKRAINQGARLAARL